MMNPVTNMLEEVRPSKSLEEFFQKAQEATGDPMDAIKRKFHEGLLDAQGKPVPKSWAVFGVGEEVELKNYRYAVAGIEEDRLVLKPLGPAARKKTIRNRPKMTKKRRKKPRR
jgi:hypothetical protein